MTNTDATRTNPITNESRLFDTFAPLNIAKVTINLDATNECCEDALNNVIIQRKDGLQIAFDDWEIDDDEGIRRDPPKRPADARSALVGVPKPGQSVSYTHLTLPTILRV